MYELPPGPKCLYLYTVINLQKVGMPFYLAGLMWYFDNWSPTMCLYAVMHGSYGLLWYLKHLAFPDKTYGQTCTVACALVCWVTLLGPYMVPGYLLAAGFCGKETPSLVRTYGSLLMYILGVCLTVSADC